MDTPARTTANIYGFLARIFLSEVDPLLLAHIRSSPFRETLAEMEVNLGDEVYSGHEEHILDALAVEYARLFIGPGHFISPHESVHHVREDGDYGKLWGADTVAVKKFIEATGLEYEQNFNGMPDHIGAELEFVRRVLERYDQALRTGENELADNLSRIKHRFLTEHLLAWAPAFFEQVEQKATLPFYRELARLAHNFLDQEATMQHNEAEECAGA